MLLIDREKMTISFFNKFRQLAIFDNSASAPALHRYFALRRDDESQRWVMFSRQAGEIVIRIECSANAPADTIPFVDYDFSGDDGDVWFHKGDADSPSIVIGMGDIRGGIAAIDQYKIQEDEMLIVTCTGDFSIRVYSSSVPKANDVTGTDGC
ncbi:MAG: hypothetical protein FD123_1683 [Bacteroidetes bacterium]|nr:MAG: hypothetical protein FD123_1683 [Bacteroidota bacterium]